MNYEYRNNNTNNTSEIHLNLGLIYGYLVYGVMYNKEVIWVAYADSALGKDSELLGSSNCIAPLIEKLYPNPTHCD